ncbi:MAG: hypothetical protein M3Z11_04865 [Candidatus Dormibacteraeota bacterium]|nr:hypothetical protein [Candidatus Dormibacteraeota bacterium]
MNLLRIALTVFSIVNVVFWAILAWAWAVRPAWAARLPFNLGTDVRYKTAVPTWARLAAAIAAFWAVAAVLYLTLFASNRVAFAALFVTAAIFLILALGAAARVYQVLQKGKVPAIADRLKRVS